MYKVRGKYIPERMMSGIHNYVDHGVIPGDFLQAVICNNLKEAFRRVDDENFENMAAFVGYFYNEVPANCWGSREIMETWSKMKGGRQ